MTGREPNFFIVGAARAGTTSLWHSLRRHPAVFMPKEKEPHFFSDSRPPWATSTLDSYLQLFADARNETAIGEASSGYLSDTSVAERIHARYPDARIIIALRHPVDRVHSLYRLNCSLGVEWMTSFERALKIEDERASSQRFQRENPYFAAAYLYRRSGYTAEHIERYQRLFSGSQLHFMLFDDLKRDALGVIRNVFQFLGVDPEVRVDLDVQNKSEFPYSVRLHHFLQKRGRRRFGAMAGPPKTAGEKWLIAGWYTNLLFGRLFGSSSLDPSLRRRLLDEYRDDIQRTMALTGRDLGAWLAT